MKCLLLILSIFLTSTTNIFAQVFSLAELIRLRNLSYPEFETAVTAKGYQYVKDTSVDFGSTYEFAYDENGGRATRHIIYAVYNHDESIHISHQTSFLSDYNRLKKSALDMGFKYYKTGKVVVENGIYIIYKKGQREVTFITARLINAYGVPRTTYEISVD